MSTTTSTPDPLQVGEAGPHVDTAIALLRGEVGRSDGKAALLLALTGAALAALVSLGASGHIPSPALAVGAVGAVALLAATVVLLLAVRPQLRDTGWPQWSSLTDEELLRELAAGQQLTLVKVLAASARTKYVRIRLAVDLVLSGLGFLTVAAVIIAVTA
ncbi:Pycsar system effector family protein [Streptomyces sp. LaBMicrA B280]|uniref:Pycsar system effector family protein n=1 Tax=Streptomyces sp. LaBMicrA B280 TaxID=3391001 RepID=UPI003BA49B91